MDRSAEAALARIPARGLPAELPRFARDRESIAARRRGSAGEGSPRPPDSPSSSPTLFWRAPPQSAHREAPSASGSLSMSPSVDHSLFSSLISNALASSGKVSASRRAYLER